MPTPKFVPLINNPMALYESFRKEALDLAPQVVREAATTQQAADSYAVVHRITLIAQLLSGEQLDAEGVLALVRKLQDDIAQIQHAMFEALTKRQQQDLDNDEI